MGEFGVTSWEVCSRWPTNFLILMICLSLLVKRSYMSISPEDEKVNWRYQLLVIFFFFQPFKPWNQHTNSPYCRQYIIYSHGWENFADQIRTNFFFLFFCMFWTRFKQVRHKLYFNPLSFFSLVSLGSHGTIVIIDVIEQAWGKYWSSSFYCNFINWQNKRARLIFPWNGPNKPVFFYILAHSGQTRATMLRTDFLALFSHFYRHN